MYAVVNLAGVVEASAAWGYVKRLGFALIAETKVEIGGSKIDEQYGDWLNIWYELSHKVGQERGIAKMIGDVSELTTLSKAKKDGNYWLYIPLAYWFNRHNGLALPLIALQYHDVRVTIQYNGITNCYNYEGPEDPAPVIAMSDSYLLIDYVYLDSEERKRFAQASHEYLIEQLQFTGSETLSLTSNKFRLNFNHPSKFLIWVNKPERWNVMQQFLAWSDTSDWTTALEQAGKLVWAATRTSFAAEDGSGYIVVDSDGGGIGAPGNATLLALGGKVSAQAAFAMTGTKYSADPSNIIIIENNLTVADLSKAVGALTEGVSTAISGYLGANGINVLNIFNYGLNIDGTGNPTYQAKLQLNGHDRFQIRDGAYFNYVQPYQHFSNTPSDGVNVYSFALKPEDHQPSGTCNFSRIDNATLNVYPVGTNTKSEKDELSVTANDLLNVYTVNYNVLRVMSGMAGTAYSN